jgi:hypothetical protein
VFELDYLFLIFLRVLLLRSSGPLARLGSLALLAGRCAPHSLHRHLARLVRQEVRELIEKVRLVLEQLSDLLVDLSDPKCVRAGVLLRVPAPRTKSVNLCMLCDGNFVGTSREIRP